MVCVIAWITAGSVEEATGLDGVSGLGATLVIGFLALEWDEEIEILREGALDAESKEV